VAAKLVVWQHPIHWYGMPPLLKLWLDEVLAFGWAGTSLGMITNTLGLWFDRKRGMAISLALNGASFGGIAGASVEIAKAIFFIAVILFLVSAVVGLVRGRTQV